MKMELGFSVIWTILLFYVLCCSLMMSHNRGGTVEAAETFENIEDLEIKQKLKFINKPVFKIIKSINGERYGCVDFYKQPGFDHPSMENHKFHNKMRLMSYPEGSKMQRETISNKTFGHLWENGIGCPIGTVPILRVTKQDLLRLKSFGGDNSNPRGSWNNTYQPMSSSDGHHFAVVRTNGQPKSYNGASMNVAIKTPLVKPNQFSSGRLSIHIGNEFIHAGWTVHPQLYGDGRSRLFVFTNARGHQCYHPKCPPGAGMILVRPDIPPGIPLDLPEKGTEIDIDIAIIKDQNNGDWWLFLSEVQIGFWPASRFKESSGTVVEWGGEVFSPSFPSPPMGNGKFPVGNPKVDSYIRRISIVDGNYKTDNVVKNTETYSDNTRGYKVRDTTESWWRHTGHLLVYGGPGKI